MQYFWLRFFGLHGAPSLCLASFFFWSGLYLHVTPSGYPPTAIGYPPTAIGYPPTAIGYPPTAIVGRIGHSEFFFLFYYGTPCLSLMHLRYDHWNSVGKVSCALQAPQGRGNELRGNGHRVTFPPFWVNEAGQTGTMAGHNTQKRTKVLR